MTDTEERTPSSHVAPDASSPPSTKPWRFTAVLVLAGLVSGAFAVESMTGGSTTTAIIEASVGVGFLLTAFAGRQFRKRQATRAAVAASAAA